MANTNSWSMPNIFDVARNRTSIIDDSASIVNRVKLMLLTEPTELYMNLNYGVGLKRYLLHYNNENTVSMIRDKLIEQLKLWEPCVDADKTVVKPGLMFTEPQGTVQADYNHLKLTIYLVTKFGDTLEVNI